MDGWGIFALSLVLPVPGGGLSLTLGLVLTECRF